MKTVLTSGAVAANGSLIVSGCTGSSEASDAVDPYIAALEETESDLVELYLISPNYEGMLSPGARVVNVGDNGTFFLVWVPDGHAQMNHRRVMVAAHGSHGTAHNEAYQELEMAQECEYAIVGLQWWLAQPAAYTEPDAVHHLMDIALRYLECAYQSHLGKVAYEGFSGGSTNSYEVAVRDRQRDTDYMALTIALWAVCPWREADRPSMNYRPGNTEASLLPPPISSRIAACRMRLGKRRCARKCTTRKTLSRNTVAPSNAS